MDPKIIKGTVSISRGGLQDRRKHINSDSDFFKQTITYEAKDGCIYFKPATLDSIKRINPNKVSLNCYAFTIISDEEIPIGKYEFEEDSTEDEVIIYYGL